MERSRQIIIAGAGIAGLTAALCFSARGYAVRLYERAETLSEVGAGLQVPPNASRILDRLGVLDRLRPAAVRPESLVLRRAKGMAGITRLPLGDAAEARWGAPYLVTHRADLQSALLTAVRHDPDITLVTGATVNDHATHAQGVQDIRASGQIMMRIEGDKIVEAYNAFDFITFFEQAGLLPEDAFLLLLSGERIG